MTKWVVIANQKDLSKARYLPGFFMPEIIDGY
jgi:hypothetical protein